MATQIEQDATLILGVLATAPRNEYVEASQLASDTGLDPDRVNDAVAVLVEAGRVEWNQVMGTAPFDFGDAMITLSGRRDFQLLSSSIPATHDRSVAFPKPTVRLFISHCSEDVEFATRLVTLLRTALNLSSSAIRCSSVDGYRLQGGVNTDQQLRREVHEAEAFIGVVSVSSVRSLYVLFELGARWGAGRQMVPLLAPGTPISVLGGPLSGLNALNASNPSQLHQLLSELATALSVSLDGAAAYHGQLHAVANSVAESASAASSAPGFKPVVKGNLPSDASGHGTLLPELVLQAIVECWRAARACLPLINATRPLDSGTDDTVLEAHFTRLAEGHNRMIDILGQHEPFLPQPIATTLDTMGRVLRMELSNIRHHEHFRGSWWEEGKKNSDEFKQLCDSLLAQVKERTGALGGEHVS